MRLRTACIPYTDHVSFIQAQRGTHFKQMKLIILPPGPVHESGLYPRGMTFKGLRTGALKGKQSRKQRKGRNSKLDTKAGQLALARQRAKEERGRLVVLSIEKAAGITRK